jgi:hypothetical protein
VIYNDLIQNPDKIEKILRAGAVQAKDLAEPLMKKVRQAVRG